jgi:hypothetical protein
MGHPDIIERRTTARWIMTGRPSAIAVEFSGTHRGTRKALKIILRVCPSTIGKRTAPRGSSSTDVKGSDAAQPRKEIFAS